LSALRLKRVILEQCI